ncbi:MAG: hypothetical protein JWO28_3358 [Hyphomicrobiales bacterium]|nr:hypothetical protein [Hyphomicrobiales bacterium]
MSRPIVSRRLEADVENETREKWRGDSEKVATTTIQGLEWLGVELSSRYDKADEYETMLNMIEDVSDNLVGRVETIFCDSKANVYSVKFRQCNLAQAKVLGEQLNNSFYTRNCWHNGLFVTGAHGGELFFQPGHR